jgi:molybdopterin synthase sulfur carrier subunit
MEDTRRSQHQQKKQNRQKNGHLPANHLPQAEDNGEVQENKFPKENAGEYEIASGKTIDALILGLGIPEGLVKLVFINGKRQEKDYVMQDGDRVGLFPPVGGG